MANNINPRPLDALNGPIVDKDGNPTLFFRRLLQDLTTRADKTATNLGQIQSVAPIVGRTEGIATTVQNISAVGNLASLANVNNTNTDLLTDGTGSPLTGGKRGAIALDTNNRLANSFRANPVNVSNTPTSATVLSNTGGASTLISVAASTAQFGTGTISYNSGSVDPGVTGTFFIFADDPTFAGGAVTYQFSTSAPTQTASDSRVNFGKILTSAVASTGGGNTGGTTPGGGGGRGFNQG